MAKVGTYEILDDLYLTEHGSVSRARRLDGERGMFAVKRFSMPVDDPSEPQWELQKFLDRARVQQMLASGGARHWAPIHELGIEGDTAFYATDYHPLSAQKLIEGRIAAKSDGLYSLVLGVAKGLSELKALRNRPHGNLTPANVLIGGRDLATAPILLSDPASNAQAAKVGDTGDLRALGVLIHQLVVLRPPAAGQWPLPPAAEWGALGARADHWRRLCSDLLNPDPAARPKLPVIGQRLNSMRARKRPRYLKVAALTGVLLILVVASAAAIFYCLDYGVPQIYTGARERYRQSRSEWFGKFLDSSSDPARQKRWKSDPDLNRVLGEIHAAQFRDIDSAPWLRWKIYERQKFGSGPPPWYAFAWMPAWEVHDYKRIGAANATVQKVQDELPAHWKLATDAGELHSRLQARGWSQPAGYLANLVDATKPGPGADVAAGVDHLLQAAPLIESSLVQADSNSAPNRFIDTVQKLETRNNPVLALPAASIDQLLRASPTVEKGRALTDAHWKWFKDRIQVVQASNDPVLIALAGVLLQSAASEVQLTKDGFSGLDEIQHDADLAQQLTRILADTFPVNIDREHFDPEVAKSINLAKAGKQDVDQWMRLVTKHRYRRQEALAAAEDLRKRLAEKVDLVTHARLSTDEVTPFETARHDTNLAIADFEQTKFTQRTIDDRTFDTQFNQVRDRIEGLVRFYHPLGPEEWLNTLAPVATASPAINGRFEAWRSVLRDDLPQMLSNRDFFKERQQASEQLRALLVSLDQGFPPAPPIPNEAFLAAAKQHREQSLERLLPLIDLGAPVLPAEKVKASADAFSQWTTNLLALSADFPIRKEIIGPGDHVDEKWKKKPDFWFDPAIQALVKDDVARLGRITALETASREQLVKALTEKADAEIALAAWRLLGAQTMRPAWPTRRNEPVDELAIESKFRERVAIALKTLNDVTEAEGPQRELAEQAPIRWRRYLESATSPAMVLNASKLARDFNIDAKQIGALSQVALYNLCVSRLEEAIVAGDDAATQTNLKALSAAATALKDRPEAASLPARISHVKDPEPFKEQSPGDVFALTLPGSAKPVQFKRVEVAGGRPFYLCTTDVSVGQFILALDATQAWPQARQLAWPYSQGKNDTRRGPRTWEWTDSQASPMTVPRLWLTPDGANDYPIPFLASRFNRTVLKDGVGGQPIPDHPVQYVSAQMALFYAALCGCRLPTPAEWESAYAATEKTLPFDPARWNLRDLMLDEERRHLDERHKSPSSSAGRYPDEETFPYGPSGSSPGRSATCWPVNDGILYFQEVDAAGRGKVFHHMVGNVAQFLCDASETFDNTTDRNTAAGIRKFLDKKPNSLFVMGGSGLSPREVAVDRALPVARSQDAYADVGIRLAFTAPSRTLSERVKWVVGDPPYIWPKPVAQADGR